MPAWYGISEAAEELEVAPSTLRKWVMEEGCPSAIGPDGMRIVSLPAVELWMAEREDTDDEDGEELDEDDEDDEDGEELDEDDATEDDESEGDDEEE